MIDGGVQKDVISIQNNFGGGRERYTVDVIHVDDKQEGAKDGTLGNS